MFRKIFGIKNQNAEYICILVWVIFAFYLSATK